MDFDFAMIGAGPGGYVGAIRASQLGMKVCIIEKEKTLGGTCLNVGCIPSKALLDSSENYLAAKEEFAHHGVKVSGVELDLKTMMQRKDKIVQDLTGGVDFLMKKNKIERINGKARLISQNEIEVTDSSGAKRKITAKNIILATGSVPVELPFLKFDGKNIISSTEALSLSKVPKHMIIVGGGVIGLELGSVWKRLGAQVSVIEFSDKICAGMDVQISQKLLQILKKQGMEFLLSCKVQGAQVSKGETTVSYENMKDNKIYSVSGDLILVAVGRKPYSDGLGLEELGIEKDKRGSVVVNDHYQTKFPNIYAIGDLIKGPMLAHKAEEEGVAVAELIAGQAGHVNYLTVPGIIYTWPEVASVGHTEEQLKEKNIDYKVGTFPFTPNGRAKAMGFTEGLCKILADKKTDQVLGVHIVGPRASDMIAEAVLAMEFSSSAEDIARSFHAHPTLAEVMREAALNVDKLARQM